MPDVCGIMSSDVPWFSCQGATAALSGILKGFGKADMLCEKEYVSLAFCYGLEVFQKCFDFFVGF